MKKKILGLDLGIASLGWAVSALDDNDQWYIDDFGVRLWKPSESSKSLHSNASLRRDYRSQRRLLRRKQQRINDIKNAFMKFNLLSKDEIENHFQKLTTKDNNYSSENDDLNPLKLRDKGLTNKLTNLQLFIVIYNISKRRGYENLFSIEKEERLLSTKELINEYKYPVKAILYGKNGTYRNTSNKREELLFLRADYKNELEQILKVQVKNNVIDENKKSELFEIVFRQRYFEQGPSSNRFDKEEFKNKLKEQKQNYYPTWHDSIGSCAYYDDQKRLTKNSIFSDLYIIYNELSKITESLDKLKRKQIFEIITYEYLKNINFNKKMVQEAFKKIDTPFVSKSEGVNFDGKNFFLIKLNKFNSNWVKNELKKINYNYLKLDETQLEKFGLILGDYVTPKKIIEELKEKNMEFIINNNDEQETIDKISKSKFSSGRINVSKKFIKDLIEETLQIGIKLGEFSNSILINQQNESIDERINKVLKKEEKNLGVNEALKHTFKPNINDPDMQRNAVVFRSINQIRLVIRALLKKYENFDTINYEVARDLYAATNVREEVKNFQKHNENENLRILDILEKNGQRVNVTNIEKVKLWEHQRKSEGDDFAYDFYDINLEKKIFLSDIFNSGYEVDHIIPYSLQNDNTIWNKVLTSRELNQKKGKRTPIEFFKNVQLVGLKEIERWKRDIRSFDAFKKKKLKKDSVVRKINGLFLENYIRNFESNFETKDLNDIRYISKYFGQYFRREFEIYSKLTNTNKPEINGIKGSVTSSFRREWLFTDSNGERNPWGLEKKVREITPYHHAIDAIILSQFLNGKQAEFLTTFITLKNHWRFLKRQIKENVIDLKQAEYDLNETLTTMLKSYQNDRKYIGEKNIEYLKNFELNLSSKLNDKYDIKTSTFMRPLVGNLSNNVIELIPIVLRAKKVMKEILYKDKDKNENVFKKEEWEPEFIKEITPKEWSRNNNRDIKLFPFPSYKIERKIRGPIAKDVPKSKKKFNLNPKKFFIDKNNTIWEKTEYLGLNLKNGNKVSRYDVQKDWNLYKANSQEINRKEIIVDNFLGVNECFIYNDNIYVYKGMTAGVYIAAPSILRNYNGVDNYKKTFDTFPKIQMKEFENIRKITLSILGKF